MKKQFILGAVISGLVCGTAGVFAGQYVANDNPFPVKFNGESVSMEGYNINDSTYFKLRDIADIVGGFTVDFKDNTIQLIGDDYTNSISTDDNTVVVIDDNIPTEYKSALKRAESYNKHLHISKQAIYDQLVSEYGEKFPVEAAQYAIDHIVANWNENALERARSYQKNLGLSTQAIYDLLISEHGEKFTESEAQYAIDHLD